MNIILDKNRWRLSQYSPNTEKCRASKIKASTWRTPCIGGPSAGNDGQGYCAEGHFGPLCELCNQSASELGQGRRKYFSEEVARCVDCPDVQDRITIATTLTLVVLVLISAFVWFLYKMSPPESLRGVVTVGRRAVLLAGSHALIPKLKLLMALYQSIMALPAVYNVRLSPWYYEQTAPLDYFNIRWDLLVVPGACLNFEGWSSFHGRLILRGTAPLALIVSAAAIKFLQPYIIRATAPTIRRAAIASQPYIEMFESSDRPALKKVGEWARHGTRRASTLGSQAHIAKQQAKLNQGVWMRIIKVMPLVLFISFSFLNPVSEGIFSTWDCINFDVSHDPSVEPRLFLRSDMAIECRNGNAIHDSSAVTYEYRKIENTAYILLALWPALMPLMYAFALFPVRKDLERKRNTRTVKATEFLHKEYEARTWWWEPVNVMQRLILIGYVQLLRDDWMRLQVGLTIIIIYTMGLLHFKPYKRHDIDMLAICSQISLLGCFLGSLNIKLYAELSTVGSALASGITGFDSQRQTEGWMVFFNFLAVVIFGLRTVYVMLWNEVPRTMRLVENALPPELSYDPGNEFHLYLSHTWSSGQDQVATIKRQLQ